METFPEQRWTQEGEGPSGPLGLELPRVLEVRREAEPGARAEPSDRPTAEGTEKEDRLQERGVQRQGCPCSPWGRWGCRAKASLTGAQRGSEAPSRRKPAQPCWPRVPEKKGEHWAWEGGWRGRWHGVRHISKAVPAAGGRVVLEEASSGATPDPTPHWKPILIPQGKSSWSELRVGVHVCVHVRV